MKRIYLIIALLLPLVLGGCSDDENEGIPMAVPFVEISQGEVHDGVIKGLENVSLIINNQKDWEKLLEKMHDMWYYTQVAEEEIDFTEYQIIAVFDKTRTTGGWSIDVTKVTEYSNRIVVSVHNLNTGGFTQVITSPYQLVKMPYSKKEVKFDKKY